MSLFHSFHEHGNFWYRTFSQGSPATYAKCGGIFSQQFTACVVENLPVKEFSNRFKV